MASLRLRLNARDLQFALAFLLIGRGFLLALAAPVANSDQRPRFHFMPTSDFTNDVQGPFYDPVHKMYHMGFAWHVNSTRFSMPNRWFHIVSVDLTRWHIVSKKADEAMLKPDQIYDARAVMTGSVTVVNGQPMALYSGWGPAYSGATVEVAQPMNLSDPLLATWRKFKGNPVIRKAPNKGGEFRDPSTAWLSNGMWHIVFACSHCHNNTATSAILYASADFHSWDYVGSLHDFKGRMIECPDFFPANPVSGGTLKRPLHVLKYNQDGKEWAIIGTYDESLQSLTDLVSAPQLLDGGYAYASKSFWDPVHKQQVWTAWVQERWTDRHGACVNATVCGTHTLPRSVMYDPEIKQLVTPPLAQLSNLRARKLASLGKTELSDGKLEVLTAVAGVQLEVRATIVVPTSAAIVGVALRLSNDHAQRTDCAIEFNVDGKALLSTSVQNSGAVVDSKEKKTLPVPLKRGEQNVTLVCFVDHSVVEAYGANGRAVITTRTYPTDEAVGIGLFASGSECQLLSVEVYELDTIWLNEVSDIATTSVLLV